VHIAAAVTHRWDTFAAFGAALQKKKLKIAQKCSWPLKCIEGWQEWGAFYDRRFGSRDLRRDLPAAIDGAVASSDWTLARIQIGIPPTIGAQDAVRL
jgi:hypothetical protein